MRDLALYIHIPFCRSKCYYCDFCSFSNKDNLIEEYKNALIKEMEIYKEKIKRFKIKTIYIGGGTPSYIPSKYIKEIVEYIRKNYLLDENIEFTIEVNPGTVDREKFDLYRSVGINRISFGLQSASDRLLKEIGRIHTYEEFYQNYCLARESGFRNISIDLIFGLPNQTIDLWLDTLEKIINLKPEHISAYSLKVEENTVFFKLFNDNKLNLPSEEIEREMYHRCIQKLESVGYKQYEISNFSLENFESKHNIAYWKRQDYLGVGLNAASCINDERFSNETDLNKYIERINNNQSVVVYTEKLEEKEILREKIILYLRLLDGININDILKLLDTSVKEKIIKNMEYLINLGLIERKDDKIRLSVKGIDVSNQVFIRLTDF